MTDEQFEKEISEIRDIVRVHSIKGSADKQNKLAALNHITRALEFRKRKKVEWELNEYDIFEPYCPVCCQNLERVWNEANHCFCCGQRLEWEGKND